MTKTLAERARDIAKVFEVQGNYETQWLAAIVAELAERVEAMQKTSEIRRGPGSTAPNKEDPPPAAGAPKSGPPSGDDSPAFLPGDAGTICGGCGRPRVG